MHIEMKKRIADKNIKTIDKPSIEIQYSKFKIFKTRSPKKPTNTGCEKSKNIVVNKIIKRKNKLKSKFISRIQAPKTKLTPTNNIGLYISKLSKYSSMYIIILTKN